MTLRSQFLKSLDNNEVKNIINSISARRFAAYAEATGSDIEALTLQRNARLAGLLLETVGGFERGLYTLVTINWLDQSSSWTLNGRINACLTCSFDTFGISISFFSSDLLGWY